MGRRKQRDLYWDGMRDGLVLGLPNPHHRIDREVYMRGFTDAERVIDRIASMACEERRFVENGAVEEAAPPFRRTGEGR